MSSTLYIREASTLPAVYVQQGKHLILKLSVTSARPPLKKEIICLQFWGRQKSSL